MPANATISANATTATATTANATTANATTADASTAGMSAAPTSAVAKSFATLSTSESVDKRLQTLGGPGLRPIFLRHMPLDTHRCKSGL